MSKLTKPTRVRVDALPPAAPPRRFYPSRGQALTMECIRGQWRPSGTVAGLGVFAVIWSTRGGDFWAAVHDFSPADQLRLIDACRSLDMAANGANENSAGGH